MEKERHRSQRARNINQHKARHAGVPSCGVEERDPGNACGGYTFDRKTGA